MQIELNPPFGWSPTRAQTLFDCGRKYYFQYYYSHNGWIDGVDPSVRKAYCLKNMTTINLLFGEAVHGVIADLMNSLRSLTPEQRVSRIEDAKLTFMESIMTHIRNGCVNGSKKEDWLYRPNKNHYLFENYYMGGFKSEPVQKIVANVKEKAAWLRNAFNVDTFREIVDAEIVEVDEDIFRSPLGKLEIDGNTVYTRADLIYKRNGRCVIVDWKTTRDEAQEKFYVRQLLVYAGYVWKKYGIKPADIDLRIEYLALGKSKTFSTTRDEIVAVMSSVRKSMQKMGELVEDGNLKQNKAKEISLFKKNSKPCALCKFKELCKEVG